MMGIAETSSRAHFRSNVTDRKYPNFPGIAPISAFSAGKLAPRVLASCDVNDACDSCRSGIDGDDGQCGEVTRWARAAGFRGRTPPSEGPYPRRSPEHVTIRASSAAPWMRTTIPTRPASPNFPATFTTGTIIFPCASTHA